MVLKCLRCYQSKLTQKNFIFSQIYCYGELLHTVQMSHIFPDSKTFVDMKLKNTPDVTIADFKAFMTVKNENPTPEEVQEFVKVSKYTKKLFFHKLTSYKHYCRNILMI